MKSEGYDDTNLERLIKALDPKTAPTGRIGVLGGKNTRESAGPTNAEIGAKHELGLDGMLMRSWLRIPLIDNLERRLIELKAFSPAAVKKVLKAGTMFPWMEKVMIVSEGIIAEGFDTGGYGKWTPSNMAHKKNHQTLVETQQLRNSVTSEVK